MGTVYALSENKITPNRKPNKTTEIAQYGSRAGLGGPAADHFGPIVRKQPVAVTDFRQLAIPSAFNIPNELGIRNDRFPMQEIAPTNGGQWSGRTGPIK